MADITWSVANLERNIADGGVTVVHYRVDAVDNTDPDNPITQGAYGTQGFAPDPTTPDFIAFDSLTEDFVLHWVWHNIDKDAVEAALNERINAIKNPVTVAGVPW